VATSKREAAQQDSEAVRQIKRLNLVLLFVFVVILAVPVAGAWWVSRQVPVVSTVSIDNVRITGASELCPGEPLTFSYDFHAKGAGVLVRDLTLWRQTPPPKTLIFSQSRRFILDGPIDQHLVERWTVPRTFFDYETERNELITPGEYRRYLAISSPSRSTVVAIVYVTFHVREDCE
jgi:hypothetical protein